MSTARLYLVRHGRTGGNGNRYVGWEDEPLDEVGRAQAQAVADRLAGERIDVVFASSLSRAIDTARPLAERQRAGLRVRDELKEIDYGAYQGLPKGDHKLRLRKFHRYDAMPSGESLHDVFLRVESVEDEIAAELRAGCNVAVVGHFWSLRMLVGVLSGRSFDDLFARSIEFKPENGSVWLLEVTAEPEAPLRLERMSLV